MSERTGHLMGAVTAERPAPRRGLMGTFVSLAGTTGITSVLGLAFWALATHRASMGEVGNGAAAVAAMTLIGTIGMAGLNTALIPHLVRQPREAGGVLAAALCASAAVSALLAAGFWMIAAVAGPAFAPYLHSGSGALVFVAGSAMTGAGFVLDEALLGLLGGRPQLWRNTVFAVSKLGVLVGLTALWHDQFGTPILTAWAAGTMLSLAIAVAVLARRGVWLLTWPRWHTLRGMAWESAANTWLNNTLLIPVQLAPVLVTGLLGAADGGAFYVAATIMTAAVILSFHFTTALYAASAADPDGLAAKLRFTLRVSLLGGLVAVPLVVATAHPLLQLFGAQYAARAALPLELMIIGFFGSVFKNHYIALCRIQGKVTRGAVYGTVSCAARLTAMTAGALAGGLTGVAVALLVVMSAEGAYAVPAILAALRGDRRPVLTGVPRGTRHHEATAVTRGDARLAFVPVPVPAASVPAAPAPMSAALASAALASAPAAPAPMSAALASVALASAPGAAAPAERPPRVVYYLQTHTRPAQIARLVEVIKEGSPNAVVLISHDAAGPALDVASLESVPGVYVLLEQGGYGDFSHMARYFNAIDWLDSHGIEYDWLENITGQDYPVRPIAEMEAEFAATDADGFLLYAPVFPDRTPADADQGAAPGFRPCAPSDAAMRYEYRQWRFGKPTPAKQRWLRPLMAVNLVQPWVRLSLAFCTVGLRRRRTIFSDRFLCYGGWFFCTLRAECVRYVRDFAAANPDIVDYFRTCQAPEEAFLQSVLVNARKFSFVPDSRRYIDMTGSRNGHSKTLGAGDLDAMLSSGANWARKLDLNRDPELFTLLDQHVRRGPASPAESNATLIHNN